jgi:MoaA/NifB/PqqE/SkfB family radical SAM enzyme
MESPQQLYLMAQYFNACIGKEKFPKNVCNAPWVSTVIEADGTVRPCFFHRSFGNIYDNNLIDIINSNSAVAFRKHLDIGSDPICQKCVCTLYLNNKNRNLLT